jgi:hypothetical protein
MRRPPLALLAATICLTARAAPQDPIHAVDWKDCTYPSAGVEFTPSGWSWLSPVPSNRVKPEKGDHQFEPDFPHGSYLLFKTSPTEISTVTGTTRPR